MDSFSWETSQCWDLKGSCVLFSSHSKLSQSNPINLHGLKTIYTQRLPSMALTLLPFWESDPYTPLPTKYLSPPKCLQISQTSHLQFHLSSSPVDPIFVPLPVSAISFMLPASTQNLPEWNLRVCVASSHTHPLLAIHLQGKLILSPPISQTCSVLFTPRALMFIQSFHHFSPATAPNRCFPSCLLPPQSILHTAGRVIFLNGKFDPLQWFPIVLRVKLNSLTCPNRALSYLALTYL